MRRDDKEAARRIAAAIRHAQSSARGNRQLTIPRPAPPASYGRRLGGASIS